MQSGVCGIGQKSPSPPVPFPDEAMSGPSTWSTCPPLLPQTPASPYLASCNVPTATFTAWNIAQSTWA